MTAALDLQCRLARVPGWGSAVQTGMGAQFVFCSKDGCRHPLGFPGFLALSGPLLCSFSAHGAWTAQSVALETWGAPWAYGERKQWSVTTVDLHIVSFSVFHRGAVGKVECLDAY